MSVRPLLRVLGHPVVPASLLVLILIFWGSTYRDSVRLEEIASVRLQGPEIPLDHKCKGSWEVEWPAWDERKGDPILVAVGLPSSREGDRLPPPIMLRVQPPDAVRLARGRSFDSDGWFGVWDAYDYATVAYLDLAKAMSVQYRVEDPKAVAGSTATLVIEGEEDPAILEAAIVSRALVGAFAVISGVPLAAWLMLASIRRWRARNAGRADASGSGRG